VWEGRVLLPDTYPLTKRNTAIGSSRQHSAQDEHTRRARPVSYFPTAHTVRPRRCRVLGDASRVAADRQVGPCCFCAGLFRWLLCCVPLARRHPMHKQQPPGLLRSGCDVFPSPGGWFEPPRSDLSGRDDATPPSVCAGRRGLSCLAPRCNAMRSSRCPLPAAACAWLPWPDRVLEAHLASRGASPTAAMMQRHRRFVLGAAPDDVACLALRRAAMQCAARAAPRDPPACYRRGERSLRPSAVSVGGPPPCPPPGSRHGSRGPARRSARRPSRLHCRLARRPVYGKGRGGGCLARAHRHLTSLLATAWGITPRSDSLSLSVPVVCRWCVR
jgi:hypothetical protein